MGVERQTVTVDGAQLSVLTNSRATPELLLLHGTFWSRVWANVMPRLGESVAAAALDFPGFGRSAGELTVETAAVPELARLARRVADALEMGAFSVAGHDIGGAVAQHLAAHDPGRIAQLVLVNSVLYDSWPVPAVARFRDEAVRAATSAAEFRDGRRSALGRAVARPLSADAEAEYLSPWEEERCIRSWMAMAAAADPRYTLELLPALRNSAPPTLLIWGEQDEFQPLEYARRFVVEVPTAALVGVPGARHIPMEDDPERVAAELLAFLMLRTATEEAG